MSDNDSRQSAAFTLHKQAEGWFVRLADQTQLGPYLNGEVALEVAATHALLARNQGVHAEILVSDERGSKHSCMIIDHMNDPHRCAKCESSWTASGPPLKCALRAAISAEST